MSNAVLDQARAKFLSGDGTLLFSSVSKLKALLIDMDQAFPSGGAATGMRITAVVNGVNPLITTAAAHGLVVGDTITIASVVGATGVNNTTANPTWTVTTQPSATTFTITTGAPGAWTSGGYVAKLNGTFLSDTMPLASQISRSAALGTVTNTLGVANSATATFSAAPAITAQFNGQAEAIVIAQVALLFASADSADSACRVIYWVDTATGLPVTPNGGDINLNPNASGWFRL